MTYLKSASALLDRCQDTIKDLPSDHFSTGIQNVIAEDSEWQAVMGRRFRGRDVEGGHLEVGSRRRAVMEGSWRWAEIKSIVEWTPRGGESEVGR